MPLYCCVQREEVCLCVCVRVCVHARVYMWDGSSREMREGPARRKIFSQKLTGDSPHC